MNQTVKTVRVTFRGIKVEQFVPNDNRLILTLRFNDDKEHSKTVSTYLKHPVDMAVQLLSDIMISMQDQHCEFDGESLFEAHIILENETIVKRQILDFFRTLHSKSQQLKNMKTSANYMNTMRTISSCELTL